MKLYQTIESLPPTQRFKGGKALVYVEMIGDTAKVEIKRERAGENWNREIVTDEVMEVPVSVFTAMLPNLELIRED